MMCYHMWGRVETSRLRQARGCIVIQLAQAATAMNQVRDIYNKERRENVNFPI